MIAALLSLPLAALIALGFLLLLACWAVAIALASGNGPDDDDDPEAERDRVDSIRAELDARDAAQDPASVWHTGAGMRRRVPAGTDRPGDAPFGGTTRINVDMWSQP